MKCDHEHIEYSNVIGNLLRLGGKNRDCRNDPSFF